MRLIEPGTGLSLREAVSRMMEDGFVRPDRAVAEMPVDVMETADAIVIKAQIPGSSKEQIDIHYEKDILTLKAVLAAEVLPEGGRFLLKERSHGDVTRTFRLPFAVDAEKAQAEYTQGLLTLTLPKLESVRPRQIAIN